MDGNFLWEALDCGRRVLTIGLLVAMLAGMDPRLSIALQLAVSLLVIGYAILHVHRRLDMRPGHWFAARVGGGHVRRHYLRDIGASAAFTMSDIVAYNAPYFTIALATHDARPMLLFDFFFKMSRALSMLARATVEAALPRITRAFHAGDRARLRTLLARATVVAMAFAIALSAVLLIGGEWLFARLFADRAGIDFTDVIVIDAALLALAIICVSVYVQGALGRFSLLFGRSLPFLAGSLLSVPVAQLLWPQRFDLGFLGVYTAVLLGVALLHALSLRRLARA
jgi:O-antigen/teichoic acid export membrane protein